MFKLRNPFRKIDYDKYLKAALAAAFDNIPKGYEIRGSIRINLDPEFSYSSVDYSLFSKEESE